MILGIIGTAINQAIQFGRIKDRADVVGIKELQTFLKDHSNIDIQYESLRERVSEIFKQRES